MSSRRRTRARDLATEDMRSGFWDIIGPVHDPPHKVIQAVYAWDSIRDTWEPDFERRLLNRLRYHMQFLHNFCDMDRGNGHPHSNWSAQFQTGSAWRRVRDRRFRCRSMK